MPASVSVGKLLTAVMVLIQPLLGAEPPRFEITEAPSLPLGMAGHAGGLVQGFPIVAGGSRWDGEGEAKTKRRLHESFVLRHDRWESGPSLPGPVSEVAYASDGTGLYIAGGTNGGQALREVWHLSSVEPGATWRGLTPLPEAIEAASGAILNDTFYVCGGLSGGKPSARLWGLNFKDARPSGGAWPISPLPVAVAAPVFRSTDACFSSAGSSIPPFPNVLRFSETPISTLPRAFKMGNPRAKQGLEPGKRSRDSAFRAMPGRQSPSTTGRFCLPVASQL